MIYREPVRCLGCGHNYNASFDVAGDYDPPDKIRTSETCEVCRSEPYRKLSQALKGIAQLPAGSQGAYGKFCDAQIRARNALESQSIKGGQS
jgi:hypothetical protein